jgi:hypothetical protein
MCIAGAQWMGGGDTFFYRSSGSTVLLHLGFLLAALTVTTVG